MVVEPIEEVKGKTAVGFVTQTPEFLSDWQLDLKSDDSSIAAADGIKAFTPSTPSLEVPFLRTLHHLVGQLEPTVDRHHLNRERDLETRFHDIEQMDKKETKALTDAMEIAKDISFWGILEDVGNTLIGGISVFFGASALAAGSTAAGGALIVSGVLSVGNLFFKHAHVWDWMAGEIAGSDKVYKEQIKTYVPAAVGITAAAAGLYGGISAWNTSVKTGWEMTQAVITTTLNVTKGLVDYKKLSSQSDQSYAMANFRFFNSLGELNRTALETECEHFKDDLDQQSRLSGTLAKILENTRRTIQVTQQPV